MNRARTPITLDAEQAEAVRFAVGSRFSVINGGAGVGKTTIVRAIAQRLDPSDVMLCAFAGKAASRLREATGLPASTIHSMLKYNGEKFTLDSLRGKTVVVDEASMVDTWLMDSIVTRGPDRLVLVGDEAQLPPVGPGQPFHDIIRYFPSSVRTLTRCYRNGSAVYNASQAVRAGTMPPDFDRTRDELFEFVHADGPAAAHKLVLSAVERGDVDFLRDIIVTCRNGEDGTPATVNALNADIKRIVNPNEDGADPCGISGGDRVICTKNFPEKDVWNGTTGTVDTIDIDGTVYVNLDSDRKDEDASAAFKDEVRTRSVAVPASEAKYWKLAYALTVHKAQGSQYRRVWFACLRRDEKPLLDRSMVYTAITRARRECHVIGEPRALMDAIGSVPRKWTVFQELAKQRGFAQ